MAKAGILVVLLLGISYSYGMIAGIGSPFMNPLMMAGAMKDGQSDMMKMMAVMSMMKTQNPNTPASGEGAAKGAARPANPMLAGMMRMGLCRNTDTNDSPFCTPGLCQLQGSMRYGNPNMFQCVLGFGCCYKDHTSMMFSKIVN